MKVDKLKIEKFAIEEYPTIENSDVDGGDLLLKGGNRSGKTLTINALLYALYGPNATLGVSPGRKSRVTIGFDNDQELHRGGDGREYHDGDTTYEYEDVDEKVRETIGPQNIVELQFVHSETDKLPVSRLSKQELLARIRRISDSETQNQLEAKEEELSQAEFNLEQLRRKSLNPAKRELEDIDIERYEQRIEKIENLKGLIDSGKIHDIKEKLQENEQLDSELDELYNRERTIEQTLRKKERRLREEKRYDEKVNSLIIDAIEELSCPVCDQVVTEDTAKHRLSRERCPQCGQEHSLEEIKTNLKAKVEVAEQTIEKLEDEIEQLEKEKEEIGEEISEKKSSVSELSGLNKFTKHALRKHDYAIDEVESETEKNLESHREEVNRLEQKKEELINQKQEAESEIESLKERTEALKNEIEELRDESFRNSIQDFQETWSSNYTGISEELGQEIHIEPDGSVKVPGNEGPRDYGELSTGETRLLNIAFAMTINQMADDVDFNIVFLDEPFANLEINNREEAISYIQDSNTQFIITTSNDEIKEYFESSNIEILDTMLIQLTWDDYE